MKRLRTRGARWPTTALIIATLALVACDRENAGGVVCCPVGNPDTCNCTALGGVAPGGDLQYCEWNVGQCDVVSFVKLDEHGCEILVERGYCNHWQEDAGADAGTDAEADGGVDGTADATTDASVGAG